MNSSSEQLTVKYSLCSAAMLILTTFFWLPRGMMANRSEDRVLKLGTLGQLDAAPAASEIPLEGWGTICVPGLDRSSPSYQTRKL